MKLKKIMAIVLCFAMVLSTMSFSVFAEETTYVAKVGDVECADATEMLSALNAASGDVTVEIYGKLETGGFGLNNSNITKLSFVAKTGDAEICVDGVSYIDVRNTNYPIEYTGLILSHINAGQNIDGFLPQYFSTYNGGNVTYTECTFPNGVTACGSVAGATYEFNDCIFNNTTSGLYSLWVYGNSTNVVVNGGEFCGVRGIKLYSEGSNDFSSLSVSDATFSDTITEKPAVVLTKGESVTLTDNTFNNTTGTVQVDDDYASSVDGKTVTIDGVEYVVDSDNLTLEEKAHVPTGSNSLAYTKEVDGYVRVWGQSENTNAAESYVLKLYSGDTLIATTSLNNVGNIIDGAQDSVTWNFFYPESNDEYWTTTWEAGHPNAGAQPTKVELYIDGTLLSTTDAQMNGADGINPVIWKELGGVAPLLSGEGTEESPYLINNLDDLKAFRDDVNAGNTYAGKYVALKADIDLSGEVWTPIGTSIYDKTPTDSDVKMFAGNFDGGNHTITGLTSVGYVPDAEDIGGGEYSFGLFGYVYGSNISNVKLANVNINGGTRQDSDGNEVYGSGVAALIGYYFPKDEAVSVIENCHVLSGTVKASNNMGGLIGYMDSQISQPTVDITIENCSNAADVTTEAREAGGILGLMNSAREEGNYYVTMSGTVNFIDCVNTGNITSLGDGSPSAGGILGRDHNQAAGQRLKLIFDGCENSGTITVTANGETHAAGIASCYYSHGAWLIAKNSTNTGDVVVINPSSKVYAGGLISYGGVVELIDSTSTGIVTGSTWNNKYVGGAQSILFLEGMDDCTDTVNGNTYYLNGGISPEYAALVDDAAGGGNFHLVETAYKDGFEFGGWYDNANFTGEAYTALNSSVKTYYAKWIGPVATIERGGVVEEYESINEAFADALEGETITLLDDATPALTSQRAITKASVIDLNGKTLTLTEDDLYFGTTTFKNGKIVVAPSVSASTAVIWMFENQTLTFDNVDIIATGVTGTYLIGINGGTGSAVNLMNESSITIDNASVASLTAVICDNGTGNTVTIDNADIDVKNIEGRFYLGGTNGTISINDSDIDLNGVKEGFYLRAGQNLSIEGTSTVDVVLNDTEGRWGINVTDSTATYNKADTATVNATDNIPNYIAFIGTTGYETVASAISGAATGDTIVLADNVTEDVTINKNITLDGANFNYTGKVTVNAGITTTVQNVNFVNGGIDKTTKSTTGTYTIKKCTFDGQDAFYYPLRFKGANTVTVEDCTVKNYLYSFLYISHATNTVSVKNVTVEDCPNYAVYFASGVNNATIENLTVKNSNNGLVIDNTANRALTIKDCKMENVGTAINYSKGTKTITCTVLGANDFDTAASNEYANYVLAEGAELVAESGFNVTTNVEGNFVKYVDGTYKSVKAIAQVGDVKYESLAEAFAEGGDIVLLADVELAKTITVKNDASLDLNGKTISGTCNASQGHMFMVNNGATMTIKDSSAEETGKITFAGTGTAGWIVDVEGALVLESGTLEMTGDYNIGYAVDVRPNAWGTAYTTPTTFVMNGGKIINTDDGGVRVASSSSETYSNISASFTMNGGEINVARDGVFVQQSNAAWDVLSFTMNDGTITAGLSPVRLYGPAATSYVNGEDCLDITLNGGTLNYTATESSTAAWIVQDVIRANGGATVDEFMKDSSVTASAAFAEANVAEGYSWVRIGNKYQLQILGGYVFVVDPEETELVEGVNETFTVDVKVASEKVDTFYTAEYIVKYDTTLLTCAEDNAANDYDKTDGVLRLQALGTNTNVGESIGTLTFTAKKFDLTVETEIEVTGSVLATQFDSITGNSVEAGKGTGVVVMKETLEVAVGEGLEGANVAYNGTNYVISVAEGNQGKQNTIKYTINGVENEVVLPAGTNEYTIDGDKILGDMTFEITDTFTVTVIAPYVTGYALVLVEGTADGYTYDGHQMFKIERATEGATVNYNGRYGWLVDGSAPGTTIASVTEDAYKAITADGVSKPVETTCDVNSCFVKDGKINFQDVSAAYACQRIDFALTEADMYFYMELYLASDVNCDGIVNVLDTAMISNSYN